MLWVFFFSERQSGEFSRSTKHAEVAWRAWEQRLEREEDGGDLASRPPALQFGDIPWPIFGSSFANGKKTIEAPVA